MPRLGDDEDGIMHRLDESRESLMHGGAVVTSSVGSAWDSFANFALNDNVLEVAIGLIIATTFTKVVNSFVSDIILPPISLLPFLGRNLDEKFAVLRSGPNSSAGYNTLAQAVSDGAVVMAYGSFIDHIINFLGIAIALFATGRMYGWATHDTVIKRQVKCKFCRKRISEKAKRCVNCTSWQDGRETSE